MTLFHCSIFSVNFSMCGGTVPSDMQVSIFILWKFVVYLRLTLFSIRTTPNNMEIGKLGV